MLNRRGFLTGLAASSLAAPAIISTPGLLMPVRALPVDVVGFGLAAFKEEGSSVAYGALAAEIMDKGFARIDFGFVVVKPEALPLVDGRAIYNDLKLLLT